MIRGMYTATSGMIYENKRQENIAQNISNIQTPGFKETFISAISHEEGTLVTKNGKTQLGQLTMKVGVAEARVQLTQGSLQATASSLDFAIDGSGFFTVQGPNGPLYTRDGRFSVSENGQLVTKEGYAVLVTNAAGQRVPLNVSGDVSVSDQGDLNINGQNYRFVISDLEDGNQLVKQGNSLYGYNGEVQEVTEGFQIYQNMVEISNVDATDAMVDMIAVNRALQANSKVLMTLDESLKATVTEIGRV